MKKFNSCRALLLFSSRLVLSTGIQRRQETISSSISVPSFGYGYYSDLYPSGGSTTRTVAIVADPTASSGSSRPDSFAAGSGGQSGSYGPVGATPEEAFIASMCQPVNKTNQPDLNFPCNKLLLFESPCLYGHSYDELLRSSGNESPATPVLSGNDQLKCFCAEKGPGQDYWQNSV